MIPGNHNDLSMVDVRTVRDGEVQQHSVTLDNREMDEATVKAEVGLAAPASDSPDYPAIEALFEILEEAGVECVHERPAFYSSYPMLGEGRRVFYTKPFEHDVERNLLFLIYGSADTQQRDELAELLVQALEQLELSHGPRIEGTDRGGRVAVSFRWAPKLRSLL